MPGKRDRLIAQFAARQRKPPKRITEDDPRWNPATMGNKRGTKRIAEDDPRWVQQLAHGPGQEHKIGADVTRPYAYVSRRARAKAKRELPTRFS